MIISTDTISYFITGKVFNEKSLKKIAKWKGIDVPVTLKKNIKNSLTQKHKTTDKTNEKIKELLVELISDNKDIASKISSSDFSKKTDLSTPEECTDFTESQYLYFFNTSGLTDTFIHRELEHLFKISRNILALTNKNTIEKEIYNILEKDEFSSKLKLSDDFYIDMSALGITHNSFSLNISLYLIACFEIINNEYEYLSFQEIINSILPSIGNDKKEPAFYYYIEFWHKYNDREGIKKVSDDYISEKLDIDPSIFSKYKKGKRKLTNVQHLKNIMEHSGLVYHYILFWNNFLQKMNELDCLNLVKPHLLVNYPLYSSLAKSRLTQYEKKRQTNHQ